MKNSILLILVLALFNGAAAQSQLGLEQYYYMKKGDDLSLVTIGYYQNARNWYGEVRYNYEEDKTLSLYTGKSFYGEGKCDYTVTPMLGVLIGQFKGLSLGLSGNISYKKLELNSQVQYMVSQNDKTKNFLLNWSELTYQVLPFLRSGIALQQTSVYRSACKSEPGAFVGLAYKNWEMPLYVFSPTGKERNYVIGISWQWQHGPARNSSNSPLPSVKGRKATAAD